MNLYLTQALHRAAHTRAASTATVFNDRRRGYADLLERVARLAGALQAVGVERGDRVAMLALNSDRYLEYYYGTWWAGAVVNPANIRWTAKEIAYSLDDCGTKVLLIDDTFAPMADELRAHSKCLQTFIYTGEQAQAPDGMRHYETLLAEAEAVDDAFSNGDDLAGVFYTGGTTGFPKGVMLTHTNLLSNALLSLVGLPVSEDGVVLTVAPVFHLAALALMLDGMVMGMTQVFIPAFHPLRFLEAVAAEKVTNTALVPTMIQMVVDHPEIGGHDLSSLQRIGYGASPISEAVLDRAFAAMPGVEFAQGYGMTEMSPLVTMLYPKHHTPQGRACGRLRSAGQALVGVDVAIVDADGNVLPTGQTGEIITRGPGMMKGYWNKPEETATALRGGWMHTGDAGYLDDDGFLYIVDRIKDMIVSGGENVYSAEVENAVASHPTVASCAVIGIPHEKWGEVVHAVVVKKPDMNVTGEEIIVHCQGLIAGYKCPRSVEFRDSLPISGAGKILKTQLREPYWKGRGCAVG